MAKSKRTKSAEPAVLRIETWQKADDFIKQIADLQLQINNSQALAKERIDIIKETLAADVASYQESIKLYHRSLEAFAKQSQADFKKQKSKRLNFGVLGWRKSTSIIIKKNTLDLIRKIFTRARAAECIRVKETVDKEALAKLTDGQLADINARRKHKDVFFVEPDLPEAVDYTG